MGKKTIVTETIHANGIDIFVYTNDFKSKYISLTDNNSFVASQP